MSEQDRPEDWQCVEVADEAPIGYAVYRHKRTDAMRLHLRLGNEVVAFDEDGAEALVETLFCALHRWGVDRVSGGST